MPYVPPSPIPPAFPHLVRARPKPRFAGGLRKRWKGADGNIYEWDYLHGTSNAMTRAGDIPASSTPPPAVNLHRPTTPGPSSHDRYNQLDAMPRLTRTLRWYAPDTDELVGEAPLRGVTPRELRRLFAPGDDDPQMLLCYAVTAVQREALQARVTHEIDLDRYAYFVECEAAAVPARRRA